MTVEKPLQKPLLLHQKERRKTATSTGLSTSQPMDYPQRVPPTTDPGAHRLPKRVFTVHQIRYQVGLQQCTD
jgi:hypothetical protein